MYPNMSSLGRTFAAYRYSDMQGWVHSPRIMLDAIDWGGTSCETSPCMQIVTAV